MKTVGIRELKNSLSAYVREAQEGETIVVTDRGAPVAQLGPPETADHRGIKLHHQMTDEEKRAFYHRPGPPLLRGITSAEILDALREDTV